MAQEQPAASPALIMQLGIMTQGFLREYYNHEYHLEQVISIQVPEPNHRHPESEYPEMAVRIYMFN